MDRAWIYASLLTLTLSAFAQPPATPKKPVTDAYFGTAVTDDYRWLEDGSDAAVRAWSDAENGYARKYLDALPTRAAIGDQLKRLYSQPSPRYFQLHAAGGWIFGLKRQPPKEQPMLVALKSVDDVQSERVVLDPNQIDPSGGTEIDFFVPSHDGKLVAVSLSKGGSESGDVHVYDVATGKEQGAPIPRVNGGTAGGSLAWNADASGGFYYTRYPREGERPAADLSFFQQVYFHRMGADTKSDAYSLGKGFPRIAEIQLRSSDDGRYTLAAMANGDGGDVAHYLAGPDGVWHQIALIADQVASVQFGPGGSLYMLSHAGAPRGKILKAVIDHPSVGEAKTIVPESRVAIQDFLPATKNLFVLDQVGGPSQIRVFDSGGAALGTVPLLAVSAVDDMAISNDGALLFDSTSFLTAPAWFRYDPEAKTAARTALVETGAADFSDTEVVRVSAVSKDGTRVPMSIIMRKGTKLDGKNPALLTGYGGYDVSITPNYAPWRRILLDRGFVLAVANLRGGGEFGEDWHRAGMFTKKQNVFDDFAACARYLIDRKYTTAVKLGIEGGSNGGLLMGAELVQHPDLFGAVVSHVGIYDMLRVELQPNGAFNVTEYGSTKEKDQFQALYAYSPYHHVADGTNYPPVMFLTGANDPRVDPLNSRKMTARLQASGTKNLVLLRTSSNSGHGIGTALSEYLAQETDVLSFLFDQLGVK
ncbi:MAG TPA: prolyl oligopeptidase family serine peptidase [Bryobacteraceae bacterium]|nr:prolyl oligopeptidase family serine peptidase [Bryobacteraceae bacterium]